MKLRSHAQWVGIGIGCAAGIAVGLLIGYFLLTKLFPIRLPTGTGRLPLRLGASGLINPLLLIGDAAVPSIQLDPVKDAMTDAVTKAINSGRASNVGVYFHDFKTSRWTGVHESDLFSPASMLKVPILIAYLRSAQTDPGIFKESLFYDGSFDDNAAENIHPTREIEKGRSYSVEALLTFMIGYSDNNAMRLLVSRLGDNAIQKVYSDLSVPQASSTEDYLSPKQYGTFFRVLYSATYVDRELSEQALELLSFPSFPKGIAAGVPVDVTVAQKFGERNFVNAAAGATKELHNCGIVYQSDSPYLLCVMTKGSDLTALENVIRDVSKAAWDANNAL